MYCDPREAHWTTASRRRDLQSSVEQLDPWAPLKMAIVSVPIYASPMLTMSQLGIMFAHGNSPGAAFCLLLLGTGINLTTLLWIAQSYGWKPMIVWFTALFGIVLVCAYAIDRPLIPPGVEPAGHTHAFDIYTNPSPNEVLEEMRLARVEVLSGASSNDFKHTLHWIPILDEWSRKLEVGNAIRYFELRPYQQMQAHLLRKKLELLEHAVEHAMDASNKNTEESRANLIVELEEIKLLRAEISKNGRRLSSAFRFDASER